MYKKFNCHFNYFIEKMSIQHQQARNAAETKEMINSILKWNSEQPDQRITISVELENRTEKNLPLVQDADYVFLSKEFADLMGWTSKETAIHNLRKYVKKEYVFSQFHRFNVAKKEKILCLVLKKIHKNQFKSEQK